MRVVITYAQHLRVFLLRGDIMKGTQSSVYTNTHRKREGTKMRRRKREG